MAPSARFEQPDWWDWDLRFTFHVEARMEQRGLSEVELRAMLEHALDLKQARRPGRWIVHSRHAGGRWIVVVEPDPEEQVLVIVTAYPRESSP